MINFSGVWLDDTAYVVQQYGAASFWEKLKLEYPKEYNMLLLASLEMQAKELENLKGNK